MTLIIDTDAPSATRQHLREPPDPALAKQRVKLRDRAGLLRVGAAALKTCSECSFTARKLRFLACFCLAGL